jgi:hypothetical protein
MFHRYTKIHIIAILEEEKIFLHLIEEDLGDLDPNLKGNVDPLINQNKLFSISHQHCQSETFSNRQQKGQIYDISFHQVNLFNIPHSKIYILPFHPDFCKKE